ncbi:MAG: GNAT family N-acetyltransferase [Deltaproteobacteria bacterium]|nr:GNAT family N-acetyltransferase [Deltaproteobacteria bacterium]
MNFLSRATVAIRPYRPSDRPTVFRLLSVLPSLYPGGTSWLDHRLDDVLGGKARCTVAVTDGAPVGITIETPKEPHKLKLSTIYVCPSFRGLGIGTRLLRQCGENWLKGDIEQVSVTADVRRTGTVLPLFMSFGFRPIAIERGRYGPDRDEMVFTWLLDNQ